MSMSPRLSILDSRFLILDSRIHIPQTPTDKWPADRIETDVLLVLGRFLLRVRNCGPRGAFEGPANGNLFNLLGQPVPICDCAVFCAAYVVQGEVVCFGPTAGKHSKNNLKGKNSVHPKVMENNPRGSYGNLFTLPMAGSINNALKFK